MKALILKIEYGADLLVDIRNVIFSCKYYVVPKTPIGAVAEDAKSAEDTDSTCVD